MEEYEELLRPIKEQFNNGIINDQEAIALLLKKLGNSSEKQNSEKYQKFKKLSKLLFEYEPNLDIAYKMPSGKIYRFFKASEHYSLILFSIYKYLSDKDYSSEGELLSLMKEALNNKRILELRCGVGSNVKVLNNLGAKTSGIDIILEFKGKIEEIDLIINDSENIQKIFGNNVFDIVYSMDFFTDSILSPDKSKKILKSIFDVLKPNGLLINNLIYQKVDIPVILLSIWLYCKKNGGDYNSAKEQYFKDNPQILYSNKPSLTKEDYKSENFEILKYCEQEKQFVMILKKLFAS